MKAMSRNLNTQELTQLLESRAKFHPLSIHHPRNMILEAPIMESRWLNLLTEEEKAIAQEEDNLALLIKVE